MKLALIGYGAMGRLIEQLATAEGHIVTAATDEWDASLSAGELASAIKGTDVAVDFSAADAVMRNTEACLRAGVPLVEGTTGWNDQLEEVKRIVSDGDGTFIFGANFSIGVNLFYRIAEFSSRLFAEFPEYETFIEEKHHSRKKDAPSGTALKIKEIIDAGTQRETPVTSVRAGNIPGTHSVGFDGPADQVILKHTARSREGFAAGAIFAAEWIVGKKGFYEFSDVIDEICHSRGL